LLGIGVIAALVVGFQVAAFAVHDIGVFELEGDAVNNTAVNGDDWDSICKKATATATPPLCTTAPNASAGVGDVSFVSESNPNSDIFTGGGSKDTGDIPGWNWKDDGGLPDKDNLEHSFAASYTHDGDKLLYFGADRFDGSGDAAIGFWFFQKPVGKVAGSPGTFSGTHSPGDVFIVSDFSNGGTVSTISVYKWDTSCTKAANNDPQATQCGAQNLRVVETSDSADCSLVGAGDDACAIVNNAEDAPNTVPWPFDNKDQDTNPNTSYLPGEFFEGGINLTDLDLGNACFSTVLAETRSSTSAVAQLKDFTLDSFGKCGSGTVSTPQKFDPAGTTSDITSPVSIGTGTVKVADKATVTVTGGSPTWSGTMSFFLCGPLQTATPPNPATDPTCTTGGTTVNAGTTGANAAKPVTSANPTATSSAAWVTSAGRYCGRSVFSGDQQAGVQGSTDATSGECFTVTPVTPTLPTTAGADVLLGNSVTDSAALAGTATQPANPVINLTGAAGPAAGGKITFTLLKNDCTTLATGTGTNPQDVAVSGNATYGPVSFTPDATGTYHWKAVYTPQAGDPNNLTSTHNGTCQDSNETVIVNSVPSGMTTDQEFVPNDSATISAAQGGNLLGNVHFEAFKSTDCTGTAFIDQTKPVSGTSPQTVKTTNTTALLTTTEISWRVSYDSNNPAQDDIAATCKEVSTLTIDNDNTN